MATSNKIATTPPSTPHTLLPGSSPPAGSAPAAGTASSSAARAATLAADPMRAALARVIGRAASQTMLTASPDAPQLWVIATALFDDMRSRDWSSVAVDFELLLNALGVVLTPEDRTALTLAIDTQIQTGVLVSSTPPPSVPT